MMGRRIDDESDKQGYIYCVGSSECPCGRVKIGISIDPDTRLEQLQSGSPCELEVKWRVEVKDMFETESIIHSELGAWRIRREWFSLPEYAIKALGNNLRFLYADDVRMAVRAAVSTHPGEYHEHSPLLNLFSGAKSSDVT